MTRTIRDPDRERLNMPVRIPTTADDRVLSVTTRPEGAAIADRRDAERSCGDRARRELIDQFGRLGDKPVREVAAAYDAIRDELWSAEYEPD